MSNSKILKLILILIAGFGLNACEASEDYSNCEFGEDTDQDEFTLNCNTPISYSKEKVASPTLDVDLRIDFCDWWLSSWWSSCSSFFMSLKQGLVYNSLKQGLVYNDDLTDYDFHIHREYIDNGAVKFKLYGYVTTNVNKNSLNLTGDKHQFVNFGYDPMVMSSTQLTTRYREYSYNLEDHEEQINGDDNMTEAIRRMSDHSDYTAFEDKDERKYACLKESTSSDKLVCYNYSANYTYPSGKPYLDDEYHAISPINQNDSVFVTFEVFSDATNPLNRERNVIHKAALKDLSSSIQEKVKSRTDSLGLGKNVYVKIHNLQVTPWDFRPINVINGNLTMQINDFKYKVNESTLAYFTGIMRALNDILVQIYNVCKYLVSTSLVTTILNVLIILSIVILGFGVLTMSRAINNKEFLIYVLCLSLVIVSMNSGYDSVSSILYRIFVYGSNEMLIEIYNMMHPDVTSVTDQKNVLFIYSHLLGDVLNHDRFFRGVALFFTLHPFFFPQYAAVLFLIGTMTFIINIFRFLIVVISSFLILVMLIGLHPFFFICGLFRSTFDIFKAYFGFLLSIFITLVIYGTCVILAAFIFSIISDSLLPDREFVTVNFITSPFAFWSFSAIIVALTSMNMIGGVIILALAILIPLFFSIVPSTTWSFLSSTEYSALPFTTIIFYFGSKMSNDLCSSVWPRVVELFRASAVTIAEGFKDIGELASSNITSAKIIPYKSNNLLDTSIDDLMKEGQEAALDNLMSSDPLFSPNAADKMMQSVGSSAYTAAQFMSSSYNASDHRVATQIEKRINTLDKVERVTKSETSWGQYDYFRVGQDDYFVRDEINEEFQYLLDANKQYTMSEIVEKIEIEGSDNDIRNKYEAEKTERAKQEFDDAKQEFNNATQEFNNATQEFAANQDHNNNPEAFEHVQEKYKDAQEKYKDAQEKYNAAEKAYNDATTDQSKKDEDWKKNKVGFIASEITKDYKINLVDEHDLVNLTGMNETRFQEHIGDVTKQLKGVVEDSNLINYATRLAVQDDYAPRLHSSLSQYSTLDKAVKMAKILNGATNKDELVENLKWNQRTHNK